MFARLFCYNFKAAKTYENCFDKERNALDEIIQSNPPMDWSPNLKNGIAATLLYEYKKSGEIYLPPKKKRTPFHKIPSELFLPYAFRLIWRLQILENEVIIALILIDRISKDISTNAVTIPQLFLVSLLVTHKFNIDNYFNNASFAEVANISKKELRKLERAFLSHPSIDYKLEVSGQEYKKKLLTLLNPSGLENEEETMRQLEEQQNVLDNELEFLKTILSDDALCTLIKEYCNVYTHQINQLRNLTFEIPEDKELASFRASKTRVLEIASPTVTTADEESPEIDSRRTSLSLT